MTLNQPTKKIKWTTIFWAGLILIITYLIIIGVIVNFYPLTKNRIVLKTATIIPYPVAIVGTQVITYGELNKELQAVKTFYQNQNFSQLGFRVDFSTTDGKKRFKIKEKNILEKLINNVVIKVEAQKRGINLTPDIISEEVDRKAKEYGTKNSLINKLKKLYNWDIDDFKKNIVEPDMYRSKLFAQIRSTDPSYALAEKKIEEAQSKLMAGKSFSEVAKKYSMGKSAQQGGKLGWFRANQMIPAVAQVAFKLNKNQVSKIIKSPLGYHIIKVEDKKIENSTVIIKISQIFVKTKPFSEWLSQIERNKKIWILMREFKWNQKDTQLNFRDMGMQKFERKVIANPSDDPSIMF